MPTSRHIDENAFYATSYNRVVVTSYQMQPYCSLFEIYRAKYSNYPFWGPRIDSIRYIWHQTFRFSPLGDRIDFFRYIWHASSLGLPNLCMWQETFILPPLGPQIDT